MAALMSIAEVNREREHGAAVTIQSWFRGCKIRAHIRFLHKTAVVIQKHWRGYLGRNCFRNTVKRAYFIMKMNFYSEMAVRIQKRWHGYYSRKYIHDYCAMKKYFRGLCMKNQIIRKELEEYAETKERERKKKAQEKEERRKHYEAQKMHYLLSTDQIPGIYNSPYRAVPDKMEARLRQVKPLNEMKYLIKDTPEGLVDKSALCAPFTFHSIQPLPPIGKGKPQGPFRDVVEVLQQRYKPLDPTLRSATSIISEAECREELKKEEWRNRVNDNIFLPFNNTSGFNKYTPLLHTTTKYGPIPYGTQHFREIENTGNLCKKKPFKTFFSSIKLFDRFQKTYSKTGEAI
eukprot:gi/632972530/ref/XP_007902704.1/ PREDICTED: spermatogenesis-associated protein 17 [Callorhinchus milii]